MSKNPRTFDLTLGISHKDLLPFLPSTTHVSIPTFALSSKLPSGSRGALIAPPYEFERLPDSDGVHVKSARPINEGLIRTALLFVDKIDVPDNNIISARASELYQLETMGFVDRTKVGFDGGLSYEQITTYPWLAFKKLSERDPGQWSVWQEPRQVVIPAEALTPDLAFQIEVRNALIVPHASVPYEDLIIFRESHYPELMSLRHHLESLAIKLSKEGDPRSVLIETEKFDLALNDYLKKARQSNLRKVTSSFTAEMDWSAAVREVVLGGGGAGLLSAAGGLSLAHAATAIGGGILTALSLKSAAGFKKPEPSPFRYIAQVEREFG